MDFNELNLVEMDKGLSEQEKNEWQAIYASYRSGSILKGEVVGVDLHEFNVKPTGKKQEEKKVVRCLIIIPYRVKIIIPENEVFISERSTGYHILHSMCGANVSYVITHIDRESGFAVASRKLALEKIQRANIRRTPKVGSLIDVEVLAVGKNVCTVTYNGYDVTISQRDVSYLNTFDLHEVINPGEIRKAVLKEFNAEENTLILSIKEATPHPFDGIETRHPLGSTRIGIIVGKYGGGVYCKLHDNLTNVLCSYLSMHYDGDYHIGDSVEIVIKKYNYDKKLVYGKILRKIHKK